MKNEENSEFGIQNSERDVDCDGGRLGNCELRMKNEELINKKIRNSEFREMLIAMGGK